jgi:hypothetical protein
MAHTYILQSEKPCQTRHNTILTQRRKTQHRANEGRFIPFMSCFSGCHLLKQTIGKISLIICLSLFFQRVLVCYSGANEHIRAMTDDKGSDTELTKCVSSECSPYQITQYKDGNWLYGSGRHSGQDWKRGLECLHCRKKSVSRSSAKK